MSFKEGKPTYYDVMEVTARVARNAHRNDGRYAFKAQRIVRISKTLQGREGIFHFVKRYQFNAENYIYKNLITRRNLQPPKEVYDKLYAISVKHDSVRILTALESLVKLRALCAIRCSRERSLKRQW